MIEEMEQGLSNDAELIEKLKALVDKLAIDQIAKHFGEVVRERDMARDERASAWSDVQRLRRERDAALAEVERLMKALRRCEAGGEA